MISFPYVDEIIPFQKKRGISSIWEDLHLSQSLKKRNFDLAVILPRSFRSALHIYLARIPIRIGYRSDGRSLFLTHGIRRAKEIPHIHRVYYYQKLVELLGEIKDFSPPQIFLREEDRKWADRVLKDLGIQEGKLVSEKWQARLLLFGKEEERPIVYEILRHLGAKGIDLTGKTSLLQLAALLERCHLLVTNDTGTMHVATAVGTPVVALFGSTDPQITGPWGDDHGGVKKDVSCSPCWKRICPTDHRCMELITVDEVEEIVGSKLRELTDKR